MEESALMRVVVTDRSRVLAYIRSLVRNRDLAEDLFQDICVRAVEKRAAIRDELHLKKWLRTAARMEAMNYRRKNSSRITTPLDDRFLEVLEAAWEVEDTEYREDRATALRDCIDALSSGSRDLIHKRYVEKTGYAELAESMNRTVNGLYVAFCRIHVTLADCITKRLNKYAKAAS